MIAITFENMPEVRSWLASLPDALQSALLEKSGRLADALQQKVMQKLSGDVLQNKTGTLRDSIAVSVQEMTDGVSASVFVDGDVPYAAIQEYGGTTKAHVIAASSAKALAFAMNGKQAFFAHVNHPGSTIPEHSYLRSSLEDMGDDMVSGMADGVNEVIKAG